MFIERAKDVAVRTVLGLGISLTPQVALAQENAMLSLTPPDSSVTPDATGGINIGILSNNPHTRLVELSIGGSLANLMPDRRYKVWVCLESVFDCSSHANPEIVTDPEGEVTFDGLNVTIFNRTQNPVSAVRVVDETAGLIPEDSCWSLSAPCLKADFSIH